MKNIQNDSVFYGSCVNGEIEYVNYNLFSHITQRPQAVISILCLLEYQGKVNNGFYEKTNAPPIAFKTIIGQTLSGVNTQCQITEDMRIMIGSNMGATLKESLKSVGVVLRTLEGVGFDGNFPLNCRQPINMIRYQENIALSPLGFSLTKERLKPGLTQKLLQAGAAHHDFVVWPSGKEHKILTLIELGLQEQAHMQDINALLKCYQQQGPNRFFNEERLEKLIEYFCQQKLVSNACDRLNFLSVLKAFYTDVEMADCFSSLQDTSAERVDKQLAPLCSAFSSFCLFYRDKQNVPNESGYHKMDPTSIYPKSLTMQKYK